MALTVNFPAVPGYVSRSVAGSYDNEGIAIFALMLTYFLWVSACVRVSERNLRAWFQTVFFLYIYRQAKVLEKHWRLIETPT